MEEDEVKDKIKQDAKQSAKKVGKKVGKAVLKSMFSPIKIVLIIFLIIVIIAAFAWFLKLLRSGHDSSDPKNAPGAVSKYTEATTINENGEITLDSPVRAFWKKLVEDGNDVLEYLNSPEDLQKLINAQLVTQYLDTRPGKNDEGYDEEKWDKNIDAEINWDEINNNIDSQKIQGIIKLKRALTDGNTITMTYVSPSKFQELIDKYNKTGSEEDKQEALRHFTLEKSIGFASTFNMPNSSAEGTTIDVPEGLGQVHKFNSWQSITSKTSKQYELKEQAGMNFDSEGFGVINGRYVIACTTTFGKIGDYIDFHQADGTIISCIMGEIKSQSNSGSNQWGDQDGKNIVDFMVNQEQWDDSHAQPGTEGCHPEWNQNITKAVNSGNYFDNTTFEIETNTENNETTNSENNETINTENTETANAENTDSMTNVTVQTTNYVAKIASWSEEQDRMKSLKKGDTTYIYKSAEDYENYNNYSHYMYEETVNFQQYLSKYTMPFDYLWIMLLYGENRDFVMDLASLVQNSEFELTVHDNLEIDTNVEITEYTRKTDVETTADVSIRKTEINQYTSADIESKKIGVDRFTANANAKATFTKTHTIITKTNTTEVALTKADAWCVKYSQEFKYYPLSKEFENSSTATVDNTEGVVDGIEIKNNAPKELEDNILQKAKNKYPSTEYELYTFLIDKASTKYTYSTSDKSITTKNKTEKSKYVSSPAQPVGKDDVDSDEASFVKLLANNYDARSNILSVDEWVFEAIEKNEYTKDLLDVTKYQLYLLTENDKYKVEGDIFSIFNPANFMQVFTGIYGNTVQEKVWFTLRNVGYSEYAVAGVMGNIEGESHFDASAIEKGTGVGFGLCQWSWGRRTQLEEYAKSKGVPASDIDTQIEFLLAELTPGGGDIDSAEYQLLNNNGFTAKDWKNAISPEEAAEAFCWMFERPADPDIAFRQNAARKYYNQFKGKTMPTISGGGNFLQVAQKIWTSVCYSNKTYGGSQVPCTGSTIDCSSYVSWVLYEYGYSEFKGSQHTSNAFLKTNWSKYGWQEIPVASGQNPSNILQPGDIFVRWNSNSGIHHVYIYVGKNQSFDCGNASHWRGRNGNPYNFCDMLTGNRNKAPGKIIRVP